MSDFERWLDWDDEGSLERSLDDVNFAGEVGFVVGYQGVSITLVRNGTALPAQTVLLVPASGVRSSTPEEKGAAGVGAKDYTYVIGSRGHPTIADFDVARGDLFTHEGAKYTVTYVDKTMNGKTEARAEAMR